MISQTVKKSFTLTWKRFQIFFTPCFIKWALFEIYKYNPHNLLKKSFMFIIWDLVTRPIFIDWIQSIIQFLNNLVFKRNYQSSLGVQASPHSYTSPVSSLSWQRKCWMSSAQQWSQVLPRRLAPLEFPM